MQKKAAKAATASLKRSMQSNTARNVPMGSARHGLSNAVRRLTERVVDGDKRKDAIMWCAEI
jgi:hypothetical protein